MSPHDPQKDAEIDAWVEASQNGESEAFGKLYDSFVDSIYRYLHYRVGAQDAEDLTELVFLKTWEHIRKYRKAQGQFSSWIFRIAHNIVIDHYRGHHQNVELSDNLEDKSDRVHTSDLAQRHLDQEILAKAMRELKDHYRQVLVLKYMNDFSNEEIGSIMGRSQAALRILQFRALRSLRRILEDMGIEELD